MAYKAQDFIDAIEGSKGLVSVVANRVGCARKTVYANIEKYESVKQALEDEREQMKDFTEGKLFEQIKAGNMTAIIFYLKTQAKDRGYIERHELTGKDGEPVPIAVIKMDMDEL